MDTSDRAEKSVKPATPRELINYCALNGFKLSWTERTRKGPNVGYWVFKRARLGFEHMAPSKRPSWQISVKDTFEMMRVIRLVEAWKLQNGF